MTAVEKFIEIGFSITLFANALLFLPQIVNLIKTKNTKSLSLFMFAGFNVMQIFTVLHAYIVQDFTLMLGFGLSLILSGTVTCLIIYYRTNGKNKEYPKTLEVEN